MIFHFYSKILFAIEGAQSIEDAHQNCVDIFNNTMNIYLCRLRCVWCCINIIVAYWTYTRRKLYKITPLFPVKGAQKVEGAHQIVWTSSTTHWTPTFAGYDTHVLHNIMSGLLGTCSMKVLWDFTSTKIKLKVAYRTSWDIGIKKNGGFIEALKKGAQVCNNLYTLFLKTRLIIHW